MIVEFTLPIRTVNPTNNRQHWRTVWQRSKRQRRDAHAGTVAFVVAPYAPHVIDLPVDVTLTRHSPGTLDDDNLRPALKAVRDGIADAFGVPDNDPRIRWHYDQAKAPRGQHFVTVRITPQE